MSLVLDVRPNDDDDIIYLRLPDGAGVISLRVTRYTRQNRRRPDQTERGIRALIDAPRSVEIVRDETLRRAGVAFETWAGGAVNLRHDTRDTRVS